MTEPATGGSPTSISDVIVAVLSEHDVLARLDPSHETLLAARLVIDEALGIHAHWDTTSPIAARSVVRGHLRRRHRALTEEALEALALHCTRNFRHSEL